MWGCETLITVWTIEGGGGGERVMGMFVRLKWCLTKGRSAWDLVNSVLSHPSVLPFLFCWEAEVSV